MSAEAAQKLAGCFLVAVAIFMAMNKLEYWGWVLFFGIVAIL